MADRNVDASALKLVAQGDERFDEGDYRAALACADSALARSSRLASAYSLRAAALDALGDVLGASTAFDKALHLAPRDLDVLADAAEFFLRNGIERADSDWLERACKLGSRGAELAGDSRPDAIAGFVLVQSDALRELGDPLTALQRVDAALRMVPEEPELLLERGTLLFETCRFAEARQVLEDVLRTDPSNPTASHTLGLIAERSGRASDAAAWFRRAHAEAPDEFPVPSHLSSEQFDRAVEAAFEELPPPVREYLANVAIAVEDFPTDDDLSSATPPLSPSILGLFRGAPLGDKASMDPWSHFPSSIVLYQKNLERFARTRDELVEQIRVTVLHEVGHFLGLDEDQLRELGLD